MHHITPSRGRRAVCLGGLAAAAFLVFGNVAAAAEPLTVGVLLPGSRSDKGWMESAYDGLMAAQKKQVTKSRCS